MRRLSTVHEHTVGQPMKTAETIEDTARIRRLTEFASDAAHLADDALDLDLRRLIDDLYRDLIDTRGGTMTIEALDPDADRLLLLDRLAERLPELDLDREQSRLDAPDDGHEALLVNGGGIDGGSGAYFANAGDDVQAFGSFAPLAWRSAAS